MIFSGVVTQLEEPISVCSNIAKGAARRSNGEKKRFYEEPKRPWSEVDTQFEIALIFGFASKDGFWNQSNTLSQFLEF